MFKKILVPYDGSEPADRSLHQALGIAKLSKDKPEVILLHVIAEFPTYHIVERPARSIKTGEKTSLTHYLKEVYEKTGRSGKMVFVVWETRFTNQHGDTAVLVRDAFVRRNNAKK